MTPEKQRIAIAEACDYKLDGWAPHSDGKTHPVMLAPCGARTFYWLELPDYLNDLNAMHEAEKTLKFPEAYASRLGAVLLRDKSASNYDGSTLWNFAFAHATAAQRAEAFLRTIGKWEEP